MPFELNRMLAYMRTAAIGLEIAARLAEGEPPPEDLSDFEEPLRTDPFTGEMLLLEMGADSIVIYSVGRDGIADGGKSGWDENTGAYWDDIAFSVPLPTEGDQ